MKKTPKKHSAQETKPTRGKTSKARAPAQPTSATHDAPAQPTSATQPEAAQREAARHEAAQHGGPVRVVLQAQPEHPTQHEARARDEDFDGLRATFRGVQPVAAARLHEALTFVLAAAARKGDAAVVIFEEDERGVPLVAARDATRCHLAFLPQGAAVHVRGRAEVAVVRKLTRLLGSLDESDEATVRIDPRGRVEVDRLSQPTLRHELSPGDLPAAWLPPDDRDACDTLLPLALDSDLVHKAVRYPGGTVRLRQRSSARAVLEVTVDGELVARAILAERGMRLYEPRQTEIPFPAARRAQTPAVTTTSTPATTTRASKRSKASPAASAEATIPTLPHGHVVVVTMATAAWDSLDEDTQARALAPAGNAVAWMCVGGEHATAPLDAATAQALATILVDAGLRVVEQHAGEDGATGEPPCDQWTFGLAHAEAR